MEKIVCRKPSRFGGRDFFIGDEIPRELVDPARLPALVKYGFISIQNVHESAPDGKTDSNTTSGDETPQTAPEAPQSETERQADEAKIAETAKATVGRKAKK